MAITVTPDLTDISLCDATGNWSTGSLNDIFMKQGNGCLGLKVSETESALITWTFGSPVDMSGGEHIYFWVLAGGSHTNQFYLIYFVRLHLKISITRVYFGFEAGKDIFLTPRPMNDDFYPRYAYT